MPELVVKAVASRRERKQFLSFPWSIYRNDPYWIPPLRMNQQEMVNYRPHPFYDRNRIRTFLAYRDGQVCGRIAAVLNLDHIDQHNDVRGFFGFFECIDDQQAANGLLDAVRDWFARQGIHKLRGPTNPSLNHEAGLLIDGFDSSPTFMMTYNPPYYAKLLEHYGFRKTQDMYAFWGHSSMLPKVGQKLVPFAEQVMERYNVRARPLDKSRFLEDVRAFLSVYNRASSNTWGFVPMSQREVEHTAKGLKQLMVPELAVALEMDGRMVGATFALLDYNPRIRQIDGRLFPFGFIRLLAHKHKIKRIRLISTNVLPEYQLLGLGVVLLHGIVPKALEWKIEEAEFSYVLESNTLSRGALKKGGAKITKTYRLYDLDVERGARDGAREAGSREAGTSPSPRAPSKMVSLPQGKTGGVEIREVQSGRDLRDFLRVPWPIYADDPQWVPPLLLDQKEFLDRRKHPFYKHGAATQFIALRGGVPLGRILASDDPRYNEEQHANAGCFGLFESPDDPELAHALLDAAAGWLRRRGRATIMGPIDYSLNYNCGLLVEGFYTPPRVMCNHNRPYFAGLLESWGLAKAKDLYCWWFSDSRDMLAKWRRRTDWLHRRGRIVVRPFRLKDFDAEAFRCKTVYNESMHDNWGFVSLTDAEFRYTAKRLAQMARPELVLLAEVDGRPVGFSITLPDLNEALAPLDGRLTNCGLPINLGRLLWRRRHIRTGRVAVLDVVRDYRRRGVAELLIFHTLDCAKNKLGINAAELGWTLEDNAAINRTIEAVGGRKYKVYRIYEKTIATGDGKSAT
jgi:GNAT superfamily N-acetyltransferase